MLVVVPRLRGRHRQLFVARLDAVERLVMEAQGVTGVEVLIVIEERLDHIAVGVLAGDDAVVEVVRAGPWATWFLGSKPWVPLLVVDRSGGGAVAFAAAGREPLGYLLGVRRHGGYPS